ncbi:MAG TPA: acetoacetate--CoA ligase [Nitriliruptorales bacterium]|nr:acetoacetate--CoA ligase [Nitriliruptorales bacterium]
MAGPLGTGQVDEGALLWSPPANAIERRQVGRFLRFLRDRGDLVAEGYHDLWRWSVDDLDAFWAAVWDFFAVRAHDPYEKVLAHRSMPGARWFTGATLNYAEHALARGGNRPAVIARSDTRGDDILTFDDLRDRVARVAAGLRRLGVQPGDRVAAYLPNLPETLVAFLATASIGAIWSSCAPEFGTRSVIDRLQQLTPKVLLTVDGYRYGPREVERAEQVAEIRAALPGLRATVLLPYLRPARDRSRLPDMVTWQELTAQPAALRFTPVAFDYPLYILFSSGTTGIPKAIVHGHGGILLEHLKVLALHHDLTASDRFFWFSTTGWMMWNYLVSGLLLGSCIVLFDGDPAHPDLTRLWRMAADTRITYFGVSAPFLLHCRRAGLRPGRDLDLSGLRGVGSTGAPLPPEGFAWVYEQVGRDLLLGSASGGTDLCTAFVGPSPLLPVHAGEIACRCLGAKVEAFDPRGRPLVGERGELVITAPMPSMPVGFWGDDDGSRYRAAYFDRYPGVWRHGDWIRITERGSCVITGRSDATLNRGGIRMGTSEFYRALDDVPEVRDALVVHLEDTAGGPGRLVLFVALADDSDLEQLRLRLAQQLRERLSPRHVPDEIHAVPDVPRTLSGKRLEVPVKRLLAGEAVEHVASEGALANPGSLEAFAAIARRASHHPGS